jgi:hypothetical protein
MAVDQWQSRIEALEGKVTDLEARLDLKGKEVAYMYIHSNWALIRWYLAREQDRSGEGSEIYVRTKNAETLIDRQLSRNLRDVHFASDPNGNGLPLAHRVHGHPEGERVHVL